MDFEEKLNNFAELSIKVGINLQKGQRLLIRAPIETAEYVRKLVDVAYKAGSPLVEVVWSDDKNIISRFNYATNNSFDMVSVMERDALEKIVDEGGATIKVYASDPELFKDVDQEKLARLIKKGQAESQAVSARIGASEISWLVVSAATPAWAAKVFPNLNPEEQKAKLWDAIFKATRSDLQDPVGAWKDH
ncbi:MAG TPA: aminopeptidase, partial [Trueperaceae bacterium]|nr:aminopeptidase [Trueperaceae bacterium]